MDDNVIQYPQLFQGVGLLRNMTVHLHIDNLVTPVAQPHHHMPFPLHKQMKAELGQLPQKDIIKPADGPTPWVLSIVVPKPRNPQEIRMCVDIRCANQAIAREGHATPTIDRLLFFSMLQQYSRDWT